MTSNPDRFRAALPENCVYIGIRASDIKYHDDIVLEGVGPIPTYLIDPPVATKVYVFNGVMRRFIPLPMPFQPLQPFMQ
jgi:hypothetical protein